MIICLFLTSFSAKPLYDFHLFKLVQINYDGFAIFSRYLRFCFRFIFHFLLLLFELRCLQYNISIEFQFDALFSKGYWNHSGLNCWFVPPFSSLSHFEIRSRYQNIQFRIFVMIWWLMKAIITINENIWTESMSKSNRIQNGPTNILQCTKPERKKDGKKKWIRQEFKIATKNYFIGLNWCSAPTVTFSFMSRK